MDKVDKYLNEEKSSIDGCIRLLDVISKTTKKGASIVKKVKKESGGDEGGNSIAIKDMERNLMRALDALNFALYGV